MAIFDIVAIVALGVSLVSLYFTRQAVRRSKSSHAEKQSNPRVASKAKAELLALMSECKSVLDETRMEIGALKAAYHAEPQPVRELLRNYVNLFTEYLPMVEAALASWHANRAAIDGWSEQIPLSDLMREKARITEDLRSFQNVAKQAGHVLATFHVKLTAARECVFHATR